MANKVLQKTVAAAFALALPLGASAKPDLSNYNLVDSIVGIGTTITASLTLESTSVGTSYTDSGAGDAQCYNATSPAEFNGKLAFQSTNWTIGESGLYNNGNGRSMLFTNVSDYDLVRIVCVNDYLTFNEGNYTVETATENNSTVYYVTMNGGDSIACYQTKGEYVYITDIYFYQLDPSKTAVTYTIKYVDEDGDSIQADRTSIGVVGDTITLIDTDKDAIYVGDSVKYVYSSDDAGDGIILTADGATITVTFTEVATYSYTVTASYGEETEVIESGTAFDQDELTVYYPEYILGSDTILYYKAANSSDPYWGTTFTIDGEDYSETITYTDSGIDDVVFYTEAEDLDGMTTITANYADIRSSQGAVAYAATSGEDVTVTTLPAGTYEITISFFSPTSQPATMYISVGSDTIVVDDLTNTYTTITSTNVSLSDSADVKIIGGYGSRSTAIDYIYITGTVSTGISEVSADVESGDAVSAPVYSLSGVKVREAGEGVSGLGKGVYIMNGKKIMVK